MKRYSQEMFLQSESGYCMPYSAEECDPKPLLGFGEQKDPKTGKTFFHHGLDLTANGAKLLAMATGKVSGLGNDPVHQGYVKVRYGHYEVEYGHVEEVYAGFGMDVAAGQPIALSGQMLHIGVRFNGEEIDPVEFLGMIYSNAMSSSMVGGDAPEGMKVQTDYDKDLDEIGRLMVRYLPSYMDELRTGAYKPTAQTEDALKNILVQGARKNYYFECLPSVTNPLGLSDRSALLVGIVQNLIIGDFLNYLAVRHTVFLSSGDESQKKKMLQEASDNSGFIDPLKDFRIDVRSFDVPRVASVYPDNAGIRWWTKAWFNNREKGEDVIEISREMAIKFIQGEISKDAWLERYYPKQMSIYHNAIEMTRKQLLGL